MERLTAEDRLMLWPDELWPQEIGALAVLDGSGLLNKAPRGVQQLSRSRALVGSCTTPGNTTIHCGRST